jgi:diguanylate cyclase (GGDEF)-like protein
MQEPGLGDRGQRGDAAPRSTLARLTFALKRFDAALPIGLKLALPLICIAVAIGGILGVTVYRSEANRIRSDYTARAFLASEDVYSATISNDAGGPSPIDYPGVQRDIDSLAQLDPSILRIDIFEVHGQASTITASSDHSRINTPENDAKDLADEIRAARTLGVVSHDDTIGQVTTVHVTVPFRVAGHAPLTVAIHLSTVERDRALAALLRNFAVGGGAAAVFAIVALVIGVRLLIFRRIELVLRASDRLQAGDFDARVEHFAAEAPRDEMLLLAARFNSMAASIQELHAAAEVAATVDQLTGLYNRRSLMDTLEREIARARRYDGPLSVMMIDLDGLKQVNDRLGHLAGDAAIRGAADALRDVLRDSDYAARLGGDEFVAVLPGCDEALLCRVLDRLQIAATRQAVGDGMACTVSAGGAVLRDADDAQVLLDRADTALYEAKRAGKNRSRVAA